MEKNLKLAFVSPLVIDDKTNKYIYRLYFTENPDVVWGSYWFYDNPGVVDDEDLCPDEKTYSYTEDFESDYKLGLAMKNTCYPLSCCIYNILALSWIDIEGLEEYPEKGRGVLKFGMDYDTVKNILEEYKR